MRVCVSTQKGAGVARPCELKILSTVWTGHARRSNETEIGHGRVPWQTRWTYSALGPLLHGLVNYDG